jgi:hypothetical protein
MLEHHVSAKITRKRINAGLALNRAPLRGRLFSLWRSRADCAGGSLLFGVELGLSFLANVRLKSTSQHTRWVTSDVTIVFSTS